MPAAYVRSAVEGSSHLCGDRRTANCAKDYNGKDRNDDAVYPVLASSLAVQQRYEELYTMSRH